MTEKQLKFKNYTIALFVIVLLIFIDQWTKAFVIENLKGNEGISIIDGVFRLQYLENRGAAFGILQNKKYYFVVSGIVITLVVGFIYGKIPLTKRYRFLRISGILIIAGALGNVMDRLRLGYVVDFFYFELINFPIFNMADIYVVVATVLLTLLLLFYYKEEELTFLTFKKKSSEE